MSGGCPFHASASTGTGRISRRRLFGGALGAAAAAPVVALVGDAAGAEDPPAVSEAPSTAESPAASYPFHGEHQAGILTPQQRAAAYVAFDVTALSQRELIAALRDITDVARLLTMGGTPPDEGLTGTTWDSGLLGPEIPADGLTITASVGASLFDDRFGLARRRPARLLTMEDFPNDALDGGSCDGDLLLQICAHNLDTVAAALRVLMRHTRGALQVRWRRDGFISPPRPSGTPRNLLGFKDGTANPDRADAELMNELVWTRGTGGEPGWVSGGSYHVVRVIRMFVEFWDRVSLREQQRMIGRDRASGAPLTMTHEHDHPSYQLDPMGDVIPFDAHIRLANPRDGHSDDQQMLRRSYNYDGGTDLNGQLDMGLVFTCFQQDLERQFVTVQKRLVDEPLVDYVSPTGGGYFFALPGVRDRDDWLGRGMFA